MKHCFEPWIDDQTKVVIVGTIPSIISLRENMYYANPQNRFWRYMANILNIKDELTNRKNMLLSNHIGLWDSLSLCDGKGSLDANIINEQYNDFSAFKHIKYFLFNGQKAYSFFCKHNKQMLTEKNFLVLPSTSPANASIPEDIKFEKWKAALGLALKF